MSSRLIRIVLGVALPIVVLALAILGAYTMIATKPEVETRAQSLPPPLVRVVEVETGDRKLTVESQGTVRPRTESRLVPEVSGQVVWVSPSFISGGFFEKDEVLVKIDPFDYRQALVAARSELARSELLMAREQAEARVAREEWGDLGLGDGTPLTLREPQLAEAEAAVEAARANLERAERNLERTQIQAPYAGRVRQENIDVGQFVTVGAPIGTVYAVDVAEVRLPLPDDELAFVDLPMTYRGGGAQPKPRVVISAMFAGKRFRWDGRVVRTEGEIDPTTRMVHAVAEVQNPYAPGEDPDRPPLKVGMFIDASIEGRLVEDVAVLPRAVLRPGDVVWIVEGGEKLRYRDVEVLRTTQTDAIITDGLEEGDMVILTPLDVTTDGMTVRIAGEDGRSL